MEMFIIILINARNIIWNSFEILWKTQSLDSQTPVYFWSFDVQTAIQNNGVS